VEVIKSHAVLHSRAAATGDEDPKRQLGVVLFGEELLETSLGDGGE
jgi:hypothetical protein